MSFMTQMQAGTLDVVIMPETMYKTEQRKGILENMEQFWEKRFIKTLPDMKMATV